MTTLRAVGEDALIRRLVRRLRPTASVIRGAGDDAAVLRLPRRAGRLLLASDMFVEGVHFRLPARASRAGGPGPRGSPGLGVVAPAWIGWKALAANISDIAAMGGRPGWAVVSLGAPSRTPVRWIEAVYAGLQRCAGRFGVAVVGGDTVRAPVVVIDVAIVGTVDPAALTLRSGARPGDHLYVTGRLGGTYASGRHARFVPRLREAQALVRRVKVHAMMDLSDGLATDLGRMSRASGVRLRVRGGAVPLARAARGLRQALMEGEDFELLFAVSAAQSRRMPATIAGCPVTRIGEAVGPGVGVEWEDARGRRHRLIPTGFRHF